jgi:hypothetical protein
MNGTPLVEPRPTSPCGLAARTFATVAVTAVAVCGGGCGGPARTAATAHANLRPTAATTAATAASPSGAVTPVPGDVLRLAGVPGPGQSDIEVHVDRAALAARHVDAEAVARAVSRFFEAYPFYSLTDLRNLKVPTPDGGAVPLREVAEVEVWFGSARTQVVVREPKR